MVVTVCCGGRGGECVPELGSAAAESSVSHGDEAGCGDSELEGGGGTE